MPISIPEGLLEKKKVYQNAEVCWCLVGSEVEKIIVDIGSEVEKIIVDSRVIS